MMKALEIVSYLKDKVKYGDMASDMRWEAFSPVYVAECRKAKLIADCGAEFGFYIHLARKENPSCRVVAFEPEPPRYDALTTYFSGNSMVDIRPHAVTNQSGTIKIYKTEGKSASMDENLSQWDVPEKIAIDVPATTLDEVFCDQVPDIIKMDIEGAEVFAFEGMRRLLASGAPIIFLEFHKRFIESMSPGGEARMSELLNEYNYGIFNAFGDAVDFSASRVILATPARAKHIAFQLRQPQKKVNSNLVFSKRLSPLLETIERLGATHERLVVYGNSRFGRMVCKLIPESVIAVVDAAAANENVELPSTGNICSPKVLQKLHYDHLVVAVLGREDEIISTLVREYGVPGNRILRVSIDEDPVLHALKVS